MKILITGDTGFVGTHFRNLVANDHEQYSPIDLELAKGSSRFNLLDPDKAFAVIEPLSLTHVLHLAWSSSASSQYDKGQSHSQWADATLALVKKLSRAGIVSWVVGTGLEGEKQESKISPYGEAKLKLKSDVLSLGDSSCRWISMPYIFSIHHQRPRVLKSCLEGEAPMFPDVEKDYLEIRDVALQLRNIVRANSSPISSVSSRTRIKNSVLCEQVVTKRNHRILSSCFCQTGYVPSSTNSDTHFTSLLLEKN
jgi:hypothetical protein